ncbi:Proline-rich nuclear receptor coactivator [Ceraceosorus bombacis]|uniref:Proline-rich nuclear receptor coactivator n=1 Tax=Ceraceosorus bombacis TaxID=401625 RepID=A0A0N7L940_9BASI|nr:Proline-rich nuclear receptor coactivator [Ceraceosorus bombacis]
MLAMHNTSIQSSHIPQSHFAHNHQSRPNSRTGSQHSSGSVTSRPKQRNTHKKSSSQRAEADDTGSTQSKPMKQQQPGLLTLSQPIAANSAESSSKRKGKAASRPDAATANITGGASTKSSKRKSKKAPPPRLLDSHGKDAALVGVTGSILSQSAPSAATPLASASVSEKNALAEAGNGGLTWQQELLSGGKARNPETVSLRSVKKNNSVKRPAAAPAANEKVKSAGAKDLTWQQALFNQPRSSGPHYDFFADDRDAATFGSGDERAVSAVPGRRRRADSLGASSRSKGTNAKGAKRPSALAATDNLLVDDVFDNSRSPARSARKGVSVSAAAAPSTAPRTPNTHKNKGTLLAAHQSPVNGRASASSPISSSTAAVAVAYAGPNFHNSPSPNSLPAPKFNSKLRSSALASEGLKGSSSASGGETESSEDESGAKINGAMPRQESPSPEKEKTKHTSSLAPPSTSRASGAAADRSATIESLLARMMAPPRSAGI